MKRLLTLSLLWGFIFPGVYSDDTGWNYKITTLQAFYFFQQSELLIDGEPIDNEDVIGAFTDAGINVGWVKVGDVIDGAGFITLNTVGNDGSDYASEYLLTGDLPSFRVFDASSGDDSTPATQNGVLPINVDGVWTDAASGDPADGTFTNLASYMLMGGASAANASGCTDTSSCGDSGAHWLSVEGDAIVETGGSLTTDDGSCLYPDCNDDCDGAAVVDDCDDCSGGNTGLDFNGNQDVCGVCDGPGYYTYYEDADGDGLGDPDSSIEACDDVDGYVGNADDAAPDCTSNDVDACGVCDGDDSSCTGCTNDEAGNYDAGNLIDDGSCEFSLDTPEILSVEPGPGRLTFTFTEVANADYYNFSLAGEVVGSTSSCSDGTCSGSVLGLMPEEVCIELTAVNEISDDNYDLTVTSASATGCGTPQEVSGITWGWRLTGYIDGYGMFEDVTEHNILGFSGIGSDAFDAGFDVPQTPIGSSQNYIEVYFEHEEWGHPLGDNFTQDVRRESPEDFDACPDQDLTTLECNLIEFEATVISDMTGAASITFDGYSTANHQTGAPVDFPANVHTYAEIDGVHHLITDGLTIPIDLLSAGQAKVIKITIGNIVPQAPSNLSSEGGHLQIDLDFDSDTDNIQDIAGRYSATSFNVYRDGGPLSEDQSLSATLSTFQTNTDYHDEEDMEGNDGYGLLYESTYGYTVTGNNEAGESTDGHRVSHHDSSAPNTDVAGRQSDTSARTDDNTDPVSVTAHVETTDGTNIGPGHYEITHDGDAGANTVNIHADGSGSNDGDANLAGDVETDQFGTASGRYLWTQTDGEDVELSGATTADVSFDISNAHDGATKSITLNLNVQTDYPIKGGSTYREHNQAITVVIDDEPNHDPVVPAALDLRVGGDDLSVLTYDDFLASDGNDYDGDDQVWYVPHDGAGYATDEASLSFDGTSTDADAGDLDGTAGTEVADVLSYQWSIIEGVHAGVVFTDLNGNGTYDFGEPFFSEDGEEIYGDVDYGDGDVVEGDGPESEALGTATTQNLSLDADVYILSLVVTDPYGDTDEVSYVIGVSGERNADPSTDAGADQEWYMNYEEDTKDIEMSAHSVSDSDHDPLVYGYSYSGPGVDGGQTQNSGDHFGDNSGYHWNEAAGYDALVNDQALVEGEHTFTLTATDAYGATYSDSFTISIYNEPAAVAVTGLSVTNPDEAFKHIEVTFEEGVHDASDFTLEDGTLIWTGDLENADYFIVYLDGEARATYTNDDSVVGEAYYHLEPALDAGTAYNFTVESYNSDAHLGDESTSDLDHTTHVYPTVTVVNPNGAEIVSSDGLAIADNDGNGEADGNAEESNAIDAYNVDISVTNAQFVDAIDVEFLGVGGYEEEVQGENGSSVLYSSGLGGTESLSTQIISNGDEIHYGAKVRVTITDVGNFHDVNTDDDHGTGVLGSHDVSGDGNKETHDDESDDSFTVAAHEITKGYWSGWHLFGPVLTPYQSLMDANLGSDDSFGLWGANWIAYTQSGEFDITDVTLDLGVGYYLALASSNDMSLKGNPVTGDPDDGALSTLSLSKGWNLVSNPLAAIIDRDALEVEDVDSTTTDSGVNNWEHAVDDGWVQTNINTWYIDSHMHVDQLVPFGGYWIHSSRDVDVHVTPHLNSYSSREVVDNGWNLILSASDVLGNATGDFVTVSLREDASNEFVYGEDEFDHPNPIQSDFIDMHIDRFDWVGNSDIHGIMAESPYFSSDVRSISEAEEFQAWNISAEAYNVPGDVRLSWTMTNDIDSDVHLVVKGEAYNLKELASIDVPNNSIDEMVIVVGDITQLYTPAEFALSSAYPNPFNPTTSLNLSLNEAGYVSVKVYNVVGQVVATLANGQMSAGYHTVTWDASAVSSGMYFVKVDAGSNTAVQKIMLMK